LYLAVVGNPQQLSRATFMIPPNWLTVVANPQRLLWAPPSKKVLQAIFYSI
jgi:hypothetical protein